MTARSNLYATLSLRAHTVSELVARLPYSKHTIYKALGALANDKLIRRRRENGRTVAEIADNYTAQKLREIHIKSLSHGIDPGKLTRRSTLDVWKRLTEPRSLEELQRSTGLSYPWVRKIARFLVDSDLAVYKKRKPMIIALNGKHELNMLLRRFVPQEERKREKVYYSGSVPFERLVRTPGESERILYEGIDSPLTIRNTGFHVKGEGKLCVLESVEEEIGPEDLFLRDIRTPEGVEDFCLLLIASGRLDYGRLLELAKEKDLVNVVGCYLDILSDIGVALDEAVIREFRKNLSRRKSVLLREERKYGKGGWEGRYEGKWNLDLYLDIGAIRHGVRSHGLPRTAGRSQE